ncbi:MAG: ROK family protein [Gammaproteobacteria bacterium]|nr:ROK family protein [Gammaproteobacteria bacterium]
MVRIGVDLGGTKIEIVALGENSEELLRERLWTPQGDYKKTLQTIVTLVEKVELKLGLSRLDMSVGVATPGAISKKTGLLKNSNSVCLNNQPIRIDLQNLLGKDIRISNDANCFALSEATDGNATGANVVFGAIVGTGTGAGIVVGGKLLSGVNSIAGEWGHNSLPWPNENEYAGHHCYCGSTGCIETFLSGPSLILDHKIVTNNALDIKSLIKQSEQGDSECEATVRRYEDRMARSLAQVINILDPDVVVLGGGMSNVSRLYKNVPKLWDKYVFSDEVATRLVPPKYGDSSGVRGAAWLWND